MYLHGPRLYAIVSRALVLASLTFRTHPYATLLVYAELRFLLASDGCVRGNEKDHRLVESVYAQ